MLGACALCRQAIYRDVGGRGDGTGARSGPPSRGGCNPPSQRCCLQHTSGGSSVLPISVPVSAVNNRGGMQFIKMRDRFLEAFLADTGPRSDVWRSEFLSSLTEGSGLHESEVEALVCNWMLQLAMWHRQPGFLWIDPRYQIRPGDEQFEHRQGALLRFGQSTAMGVSREPPRWSLVEIGVNRDIQWLRYPVSERPAGVSQWTPTVSAREILRAEYPLTSSENGAAQCISAVRLMRGWSVDYSREIEQVT